MLAALNYLHVYATNIGNTYLNVTFQENIWTISGPEFGINKRIRMIIISALYGLKISGALWRSILANTLGKDGLVYTSSEAKKDVWIKREVFPNGKTYYSMILVYVDETMVVSKDTSTDINYLENI